jgi:hypothetical protein
MHPAPCDSQPYCQGEWAACARVPLRATPSDAGGVVAVVDSGTRVTLVAGELQTRPGLVLVRDPVEVQERVSTPGGDVVPADGRRWQFGPGDTVHIIGRETDGDSYANYVWRSRRGDGTTAPFWGGRTEYADGEGDPFAPVDSGGVTLQVPLWQRWWAQVRTADGRTGWTRAGREWAGESYYDEPLSSCAGGA